MIACIDDGIGRVLRALDASGQRDNTVIIFTTDHGDHLGDHRLLLKGCEQYQSILHVPFIWSDPQAPAAAATDAIGSTIDIPATILDRARIQPYVGMQGKSLLPSMGPDGKPVRDCAFVQYEHQMADKDVDHMPRWHTIVDQRYRMTVMSDSGLGELYDLETDPGEFDNLWDRPEHAGAEGAADGAAASARDRAYRHGAVSDRAGVSLSCAGIPQLRRRFYEDDGRSSASRRCARDTRLEQFNSPGSRSRRRSSASARSGS